MNEELFNKLKEKSDELLLEKLTGVALEKIEIAKKSNHNKVRLQYPQDIDTIKIASVLTSKYGYDCKAESSLEERVNYITVIIK